MSEFNSDSVSHDIHCNSNEIKDLIPKLITRIEFNKHITYDHNCSETELISRNLETVNFLKDLRLFVNTH